MCTTLILGSLKISLTLFNALHILAGLCILSFGGYLQIDYGTYVITIVTLSVGAFITILGCLGVCAVRAKSWCLLTTYSIFMAVLFFVNLSILIVAFVDYDTFVGGLDSNNSDIKEFKDNVDRNKNVFYVLQAVIVFIECVCVWFGLMMRKHDGDILNDGYEEFNREKSNDLAFGIDAAEYQQNVDEKMLTEAQRKRQALREKYGLNKE